MLLKTQILAESLLFSSDLSPIVALPCKSVTKSVLLLRSGNVSQCTRKQLPAISRTWNALVNQKDLSMHSTPYALFTATLGWRKTMLHDKTSASAPLQAAETI